MKMPVIVNVHPTVYDELKERNIKPWFLDPGFNDKLKLKDCIKELYNDASLRRKMGRKGYNYVKEWHDPPICGERFLSIISLYLLGEGLQEEVEAVGDEEALPPEPPMHQVGEVGDGDPQRARRIPRRHDPRRAIESRRPQERRHGLSLDKRETPDHSREGDLDAD